MTAAPPTKPGQRAEVVGPSGWLLGIPAGAIVFAAVLGLFIDFGASQYHSDLVATTLGVFAGGMVALWSDRSLDAARRDEEKKREADASRVRCIAELQRQWRVVGLLHDELTVSRHALQDAAGRAKRPRPDLFFTPLPTETWDGLTASGELANVPSPDLVGYFAEAYHWVRLINQYEAMMLRLQFHPAGVVSGVTSAGAPVALRAALDRLRQQLEAVFDPVASKEVAEAVDLANTTFAEIERQIAAIGGTVPGR